LSPAGRPVGNGRRAERRDNVPVTAGAVLFDLYDTLATMDREVVSAARRRGAELAGVDADRLGALWSASLAERSAGRLGPPREELRALLAGCDGGEVDDAVLDAVLDHEARSWPAHVRLYDDVLPTLDGLRRAGCRVAIVSNCSWQTGGVVESTGLLGAVDAAVLSFEVGALKPDRAILRLALERLDADPGRSLLVDDVPANLDAARSLGMATVLMDRTGAAAATAHPAARDLAEAAATPGWRRCLTGGSS
jgi:putative hydrolase of the HAD superfamily